MTGGCPNWVNVDRILYIGAGNEPGEEEEEMPQPTRPQDDQAQLFHEVVLVLGGVFAVQGTDDETIRRVASGLQRVYRRARHKQRAATLTPHPAIAALLHLTEAEGDQS